MKENLNIDNEFLEELIMNGIFHNKSFFLKLKNYLQTTKDKSYFRDMKNQKIFNLISKHYDKFSSYPDLTTIKMYLKKLHKDDDEMYTLLSGMVKKYISTDPTTLNFDFLNEEAKNFIIQARTYEVFCQVPSMMEDNNFGKIVEMVKEAINVNFDNNLGLSIRDLPAIKEKLNSFNTAECTPTGIPTLDSCLGGGIRPGELFVLSAVPGGFKTGTLGCIGLHNFMLGKKVIIYSMETGEERLASRYIQNIANVSRMEVSNQEYEEKLIEKLSFFGGELLVKQFKANEVCCNDIESHITEVENHFGWSPDLICLDYLLIMRTNDPRMDPSASYKYYKTISEEARNIGISRKIPIFSAIQINREGMGEEGGSKKITTAKNISESAGVYHTADYFMTINQTADQKVKSEMMFYLEKNRNGEGAKRIDVSVDYEHMRLNEKHAVKK